MYYLRLVIGKAMYHVFRKCGVVMGVRGEWNREGYREVNTRPKATLFFSLGNQKRQIKQKKEELKAVWRGLENLQMVRIGGIRPCFYTMCEKSNEQHLGWCVPVGKDTAVQGPGGLQGIVELLIP